MTATKTMGELNLMRGNWISTIDGNFQAIDVMCDSVNTMKHEGLLYEDISGIALTPEILEKCGFKREDLIEDYFHIGDHFFCLKLLKGKFLFTKFWHVEVKHLHQLQNLYFCLCGEHLKIEL